MVLDDSVKKVLKSFTIVAVFMLVSIVGACLDNLSMLVAGSACAFLAFGILTRITHTQPIAAVMNDPTTRLQLILVRQFALLSSDVAAFTLLMMGQNNTGIYLFILNGFVLRIYSAVLLSGTRTDSTKKS